MFDLVVKNAKVVNHDRIFDGTIGITGEKIALVSGADYVPEAREVIDAGHQYVLPGIVDPHVHLACYPTWPVEQGIEQQTKAAVAGGVTTVVHFLYANYSITQGYKEFMKVYKQVGYVDLAFHAAILRSSQIEEIPQLAELGICSYKFLLPYKGPEIYEEMKKAGIEGLDDGIVFEAFSKIASLDKGAIATIHAENPEMFFAAKDRIIKEGNVDRYYWTDTRPNYNEATTMIKICEFAKVTDCPIYFVHVTIKEGGEIIRKYRAEGVQVMGETCPQYLCLNVHNADRILSKVNPPIRHEDDNKQLWEDIRNGSITSIGSDDAPVHVDDKQEFWSAIVGMANIQTSLQILLSEGVNKGKISLEKLVEIFSYNPSRIFGLYPHKGAVQVGADADLVFVDLEKRTTISSQGLLHLPDYTPYEGWKIKGLPTRSLIRGKVVMEDGKVIGDPGYGRFYPMKIAKK